MEITRATPSEAASTTKKPSGLRTMIWTPMGAQLLKNLPPLLMTPKLFRICRFLLYSLSAGFNSVFFLIFSQSLLNFGHVLMFQGRFPLRGRHVLVCLVCVNSLYLVCLVCLVNKLHLVFQCENASSLGKFR